MLTRIVSLLWWPRRLAAVLLLLAVGWNLLGGSISLWWVTAIAAVHVVVAIGLWYRRSWAWLAALVLQVALPLSGMLAAAHAFGEAGWWLQQLPHAAIVALLLLPEGRRARASSREPGFEPGDTTPAG